jgi:hypothetical protein
LAGEDSDQSDMDAAKQIDRKKIQENGWHQGAVCPFQTLSESPESAESCKAFPQSGGELAILISQDCDIVNDNLTKEPFADWLIARCIKELDGTCLYGKNARKLHFQHNGIFYEVLAYERVSTSRKLLEKISAEPSQVLPSLLTKQAAEWLSKRYIRPAYPDAFNKRINEAKKQAKKTLKKDHELFRLILIKIHPNKELPADQTYSVSIVGVMRGTDYRNAQKCERAQRVLDDLEVHLADCEGIKVEECRPRSDEEVRLSWLDYYVPWDFDYLTFQDLEDTDTSA